MLVIVIACALVGLEAVRRQKRAVLVTEFQFRLFCMRDNLRDLALSDPATCRSWVFAYLDSTTAKAIGILPRLSVWKLLALESVYKNDEQFDVLSKNLERELEKPQFRELKVYGDELMTTLGDYLTQRHNTLHGVIALVDHVSDPIKIAVAEARRRSLDVAMKSPETSTLPEYAPAFLSPAPCPV